MDLNHSSADKNESLLSNVDNNFKMEVAVEGIATDKNETIGINVDAVCGIDLVEYTDSDESIDQRGCDTPNTDNHFVKDTSMDRHELIASKVDDNSYLGLVEDPLIDEKLSTNVETNFKLEYIEDTFTDRHESMDPNVVANSKIELVDSSSINKHESMDPGFEANSEMEFVEDPSTEQHELIHSNVEANFKMELEDSMDRNESMKLNVIGGPKLVLNCSSVQHATEKDLSSDQQLDVTSIVMDTHSSVKNELMDKRALNSESSFFSTDDNSSEDADDEDTGEDLLSDSDSAESTDDEDSSGDDENDDDLRIDAGIEEKSVKVPPPLLTAKELTIEDLPEVQYIDMVLDEKVEMRPLGSVSSIIGQLVIIKSLSNTPALDMETVLFKEDRQALGKVFEVFGPVNNPMYSMRVNSTSDINKLGIRLQLCLFYAPSSLDLTAYVFTSQLLKMKGSDASWKGDEEPPAEQLDYSDDEQEKIAKNKGKQCKEKRKIPTQRINQKSNDEKGHFTENGVSRNQHDKAGIDWNNRSQVGRSRRWNQVGQYRSNRTWTTHNYEQYVPPTQPMYQEYSSPYPQIPVCPQNNPFPTQAQQPPHLPAYAGVPAPNMSFPPPPVLFPGYPPAIPPYVDTSRPPPPLWNTHVPSRSTSGQHQLSNNSNNGSMNNMLTLLNTSPPPPPPPT